jgi:hypothetical protein
MGESEQAMHVQVLTIGADQAGQITGVKLGGEGKLRGTSIFLASMLMPSESS